MKKKLTREQWEKIADEEEEKEKKELKKIEKLCDKLSPRKPAKERLKYAKKAFGIKR